MMSYFSIAQGAISRLDFLNTVNNGLRWHLRHSLIQKVYGSMPLDPPSSSCQRQLGVDPAYSYAPKSLLVVTHMHCLWYKSDRPHLLRGLCLGEKTHLWRVCRHLSSSVTWSVLYLPIVRKVISHGSWYLVPTHTPDYMHGLLLHLNCCYAPMVAK